MADGIKLLRDVRIPMNDGVALSAALWLPAAQGKYPCIIDMIPYRWRDGISARDKAVFEPLAENGFACLRLDVRGAGESQGILDDEYTERQIKDSLNAIDWITRQPWSNGKTGMMGNSWGGFSALGALKAGHPALKAGIISCASDDGHTDDAHFECGVPLSENWLWGIHFTTLSAMPTDLDLALGRGEDWIGTWKKRLAAVKPFPSYWMQQRASKSYAEVRNFRNLDDSKAPLLLVGGWLDSYARGQWRLSQHLKGESKVLLGGQAHAYPHRARRDLSMDFTPMIANWFGKYLGDGGVALPDAAWIFTRKIPSAEDPRASGWWLGLSDRHRELTVTLPAPDFVSAPVEKSGLLQSFGKFCPGGDGGNEYLGYPSNPAPDIPRSWVYKFAPFESSDIFVGMPSVEVKHPAAFAGGVYMVRLFVNRKEFGLRRIGYAVIDGRTEKPRRISFTPFGWQADPGDHLEIHILPQAWPLLWAPYPSGDMPKNLFGPLSLKQPESWREADIKPAKDAPVADETPTAALTVVEKRDGWSIMRIENAFAEYETPDRIICGDGLKQLYEYGPNGEMKARFVCRYTLRWPGHRDGVSVTTDISIEAAGNDIKSVTQLTATHGTEAVFRQVFNETLKDALLPPLYE